MTESGLRTGINWSFIAVTSKHLVQFSATIILARLLAPEDFGLAAMVATMTNFLSFFLDFGLSWVTIQKEKLDDQQISNLFWINTLVGIVIGSLCLLATPQIAAFYQKPSLEPFLYLQSLTFLFFGVAVQPIALLKRRMEFKKVAVSDMGSAILGSFLTLGMALLGFGTWSLIAPSILTHFARTLWVFYQSRFPLKWPRPDREWLSHFHVGTRMTAASFCFYFARNLDDILIGRFLGASSLGFYSRSYLLANLPTQLPSQTLSPVVISAISRAREKGDKDWHSLYHKTLIGFSFVVSPICAGLALTANDTVRLLYGAKWLAVIPVLTWLSLAGIFQPAYTSVGWLLVAQAKYRAYFWWSLISALVLAGGFATAIFYDIEMVALAYFICSGIVLSVPSQFFAHLISKTSFKKVGGDLLRIYLAILAMAVVVKGIQWGTNLSPENFVPRLLLTIPAGIATYAAVTIGLFRELPVDILERFRRKHLSFRSGAL